MTASPRSPDRPPEDLDSRDRNWIVAVRAGDSSAFEAMFRAYAHQLVSFADTLLRSRDEAEEVVQELFLRIWRQRSDWEVPGPLNTYLYRAARNGAISRIRHARIADRFRVRVAGGAKPDTVFPRRYPADERVRHSDLASAIDRAVGDLSDRCREVFRLSRHHHLSHAEVASVLGISVNTVEVQMTRALAFLRKRRSLAAFVAALSIAAPGRLAAQDLAARKAAAMTYLRNQADWEEMMMIPMRDGIRLSSLILFPKGQPRRGLPTVLVFNPYLTESMVDAY